MNEKSKYVSAQVNKFALIMWRQKVQIIFWQDFGWFESSKN